MKASVGLLLIVLVLTASALAVDGKSVSYKSGDETVQGILYTPAGKGRFPALVVIHEWWGLNDWVKEQASKLADQGYVALAVDLYRGKVAKTPDEERHHGESLSRVIRPIERRISSEADVSHIKWRQASGVGSGVGSGAA